VQIGGARATLGLVVTGFSSFLGPPTVFADLADSRKFLPYPDGRVGFVAVKLDQDAEATDIKRALQSRFAQVSVFTREEFSNRSRVFWLTKTGAGAALLLAAILGFLIGLSVVAQTIYTLTAENVGEYTTLKAMGATNAYVRSIVLMQSLLCVSVGGALGLLMVAPLASAAQSMVTWIAVPAWIYVLVSLILMLLSICAGLIAARPATSVDPARAFYA
jgi:putative ABC transport system permease protein